MTLFEEITVFGKLLLLFILVPLADLLLLMTLSAYTGLYFSIGMVVVSGVVGAWLAKLSYRSVLAKIMPRAGQPQVSPELLTDGAMILFAAGLLLTPGFITDAVGFSLLIPACRRGYKGLVTKWFKKNFNFRVVTLDGSHSSNAPEASSHDDVGFEGEVFEGDVVEGEILDRPVPAPKRIDS